MSLANYFHTARYLRLRQIYGRIWFRLHRPRPDLAPAPQLRARTGPWQEWVWRPPLMRDTATFHFLNVTGGVHSAVDWDDPALAKLWRYNLHYFDDLNAQDATMRQSWHRALIGRWARENPPGLGTGWEPYPTSLRIVNWIKGALRAAGYGESLLDQQALDSLAVQTRWLQGRLEYHLLANHLWANAKALVFAGLFFSGPEAQRWLGGGAAIIERELVEQILADGGHFERSPMYHAIVLEDVLDLINVAQAFPESFPSTLLDHLRTAAIRMLRWLRVMSHPDGRISFFNDAAFGIAATHEQLAEFAASVGLRKDEQPLAPMEVLAASGYVRLQNARATVICDVAPVGPDYLPGHAHADTLSFELSLDGERVLVNSGTSTYALSEERQRQRGTAAHNTVVVDGQDSSEVWGGFRVARRARPSDVAWGDDGRSLSVVASHDGYRRLPGRVTHRRRWVLEMDGLLITDRLKGTFESASAAWHLAPGVHAHLDACSRSAILSPLGQVGAPIRFSCEPPVELSALPSTWHPGFGQTLKSLKLMTPLVGPSLATRLRW